VRTLPLLLLTLVLGAAAIAAPSGAVIREPGAIYLEDLTPKAIRLPVTADAPIYYQSDRKRFLGVLKKGQAVELQAIGPAEEAYRVRGMAQQGQVAGWVEPQYLAPLKKQFVENLKQNAARREEVLALISRAEVAINMTPDEVLASLGKPGRKASKLDANGRQETWEFIKYEQVPQQIEGYDRFGRVVLNTVLVKVPVGKLSIVFENDLVTSLEQTEGNFLKDPRAKMVIAPMAMNTF